MRVVMFLSFCLLCGPAVAVGAEAYPYTAQILQNNTPVRSGPTEKYYPTDMLHRGDPVEIYRHETGDWYAIRPPKGSFSWVPATHLKVHEDNLGEVLGHGAVAYVGSRLSDARTVKQIQLNKGEILEVVGEKEFVRQEDGTAERWYKIRPPSGEFRWVFGPDVLDSAPLAGSRETTAEGPEAFVQLQHQTNIISGAPDTLSVLEPPARMDLQLSMIVAGPLPAWNFDDLKARAERKFQNAQTALERGRARLVLNEIGRFEILRDEYLASGESQSDGDVPTVAVAPPPSNPLQKIPDFEEVGRLTPVVSRKPGAPKFALTDVKGKVMMFVSPATGVDLRPYLGKVVGVSGARGFMPRLKKPHLAVSQVEILEPAALLAKRPPRGNPAGIR